jgi:hypothetical protein
MPQKDAVLYIRVVDPTAKPDGKKKVEYPWDDVHFVPAAQLTGSPVRLNRVFMAKPGTYDVYIMAKERLADKAPKNTVVKAGLLKTSVPCRISRPNSRRVRFSWPTRSTS